MMAMVRISLILALLSTAGCYSLQSDIVDARADIQQLQGKIPPESPLWIFEGPDRFDSFVTDYDLGLPDFLYHHLLKRLNAMSDAEIDAQAKGDFSLEECSRDPAQFRGKIWRVHGVIGELHAEWISDPKHPLKQAHAGVFFDSSTRPFLFHVASKPEVLTLRQDVVETQAVFVKWIEYTSKSGRLVTAPFFIGKTLRRYL
jgi:hypothetical protein